jgi:hypothetical protein
MENLIETFVKKLPDSEKRLIIDGYEKLSVTGAVGDEPIRIQAEALMKEFKTDTHVSLWMSQLAFECYRYFAKLYFTHLIMNEEDPTWG